MSFGANKKVLVTGITGLIGKELVKPLIKAGFEIYAITRSESFFDNDVNYLHGNLFDENFITQIMEQIKPNYLLNMAWAATNDYLSSDINYKFLQAGIHILKEFHKNGGKRVVFAGTCFEYKFKDEPLVESDELDTHKTVYTFCKDELRRIAEFYCKQNEISFAYGRIFYVYGKNENSTRLTGMLIEKLKNNQKIVVNSGNLVKDYMYAKDIAHAFVAFLESKVEGVVNICSGKAISIKDYSLQIAKEMGKEDLLVFEDKLSNQPPIILGNNDRLIHEVGFKLQYSSEEAVKEIVNN